MLKYFISPIIAFTLSVTSAPAQSLTFTVFLTESGEHIDLSSGELLTSSCIGSLIGSMPFNSDQIGANGLYGLSDMALAWRLSSTGGLGSHPAGFPQEDDSDWWMASSQRAMVRVIQFDAASGAGLVSFSVPVGRADPFYLRSITPRFGVGTNQVEVALGWTSQLAIDAGESPSPAGDLVGMLCSQAESFTVIESAVNVQLNTGGCWLETDGPGVAAFWVTTSSAVPPNTTLQLTINPPGAATLTESSIIVGPAELHALELHVEDVADIRIQASYIITGSSSSTSTTELWVAPLSNYESISVEESSSTSGLISPSVNESYAKCRSAAPILPNPQGVAWTTHGYCSYFCSPPTSCAGQTATTPGTITTPGGCYGLSFSDCTLVLTQTFFLNPYMFAYASCANIGCGFGVPPGHTIHRHGTKPICVYQVSPGPPIMSNLPTCAP